MCSCMILRRACQLLDTERYLHISMIHCPPFAVDSYSVGYEVQHHVHRYLPPDFVLCMLIPFHPLHLQSATPFYF